METRKFLNRVFDFRKNWPFLAGFSVFWITVLVFIALFALELTGIKGEGAAFTIVFMPVVLPGLLFSHLLGSSVEKHPLVVTLISGAVNGTMIWSAAFVIQTLAIVFLKVFKKNRIRAKI